MRRKGWFLGAPWQSWAAIPLVGLVWATTRHAEGTQAWQFVLWCLSIALLVWGWGVRWMAFRKRRREAVALAAAPGHDPLP